METITPRYEFRAFAQNFGLVEEKMRRFSQCENIRENSEIYILSADNNNNNTKIRNNTLDIKAFIEEREGLEQWSPRLKKEFPISNEVLQDEVLPAFGSNIAVLDRSEYTFKQYLEELIRPQPALSIAHVFKRRFSFTVSGCQAEIAELLINGAAIKTVAVESEQIASVLQAKQTLGLQEYGNVNYLLALKRIMGMEPLPD